MSHLNLSFWHLGLPLAAPSLLYFFSEFALWLSQFKLASVVSSSSRMWFEVQYPSRASYAADEIYKLGSQSIGSIRWTGSDSALLHLETYIYFLSDWALFLFLLQHNFGYITYEACYGWLLRPLCVSFHSFYSCPLYSASLNSFVLYR